MPQKKSKFTSKEPRKSKASPVPESENDFLEAADEFEASAGKWKAGDAARAFRFYQRAMNMYEDGLKTFPRSFDLAYNKALLLYNISQDSRIVSMAGPILDLLKQALDAHRYALGLDADNCEVLFNTAQVLTSLAEELDDFAEGDANMRAQAVSMLQEAVDLFNTCLQRQEQEFSELQKLISGPTVVSDNAQDIATQCEEQPSQEDDAGLEEWVTVKEPVTPNTLLETALAQLGSLTSLVSIVPPTSSSTISKLTEIATPLVTKNIPSYIMLLPEKVERDPKDPTNAAFLTISGSSSSFHNTSDAGELRPQALAQAEVSVAVALFTAAVAGAEFSSSLIAAAEYHAKVDQAIQPLMAGVQNSDYPAETYATILAASADVLIDMSENIAESDPRHAQDDLTAIQWTALETAQRCLAEVINKFPSGGRDASLPSKAQTYLIRAKVELLRRALTMLPSATASLKSSERVLLKNAGVYYRGAKALAQQEGDSETMEEAHLRGEIVKAVEEGRLGDLDDMEGTAEMREEGLLLDGVQE